MQTSTQREEAGLDEQTRAFYVQALQLLTLADAPFLVGGAYAFQCYTGIERHTKDLDVFARPQDCKRILRLFADAGYATELTYPHWLGKVFSGDLCVDVIFSSGNGVAVVDDQWFAHAVPGDILGEQAKLIPPEEMIWSKSFVLERERYDGADVTHLLRACARSLDWPRLLRRFGADWRLLYSHLILYGYIYPGERAAIPQEVMRELERRLRRELSGSPADDHLCNGPILSREQYLTDLRAWGYKDARSERGAMSADDIAHWTAAISRKDEHS